MKFVHSTWTQTIQIQHWDKNLYALCINYSPLPWVLCHLLALALNKTNVQFQILHGLYTMQIQMISGSLGHSFSSLWALCAPGGWLVMYSPSKRHWCHPFYLCSIHFLLSPAPAWCWWWLGPDLAPGHGHQRNWVLAAGWSPAGTSTSPALPRHISGASTPDFVTAEFLGTARWLLFHEVSTTPEITKMLDMRHNIRDERLHWWWNNFISFKKSTFSCEKLNHTGRRRVLIV